MTIDLTGKTALVCGATQGIGRAIAAQFASCGARVVLLARNAEALEHTRASLISPERHRAFIADFSRSDEIAACLADIVGQETIDIVINNTGGPAPGALTAAKPEEFTAAFGAHILVSHTIMQHVLPGMKERGFGRFINIVSTSVRQPLDGLGVSNTIRGAMAGWAKTLANETAQFGITVNNILPGATKTGRLDAIITRKSTASGKTSDEVTAEMEAEIPARRLGEPEEIAYLAAFLASGFSGYITGTSIAVDGGRTKAL